MKLSTLLTIAALAVPASISNVQAGPSATRETAVAPEKNPPGDIPDSQVFVTYKSASGYAIKVPEGWSRSDRTDGVRFSDKYNIIDLAAFRVDQPPNAATVKMRELPELEKSGHAIEVKTVKDVKLKSGPAVLISYAANSEPNAVTGKQIRLEHDRYLMFRNGTLISLDMSAPLGADNVDQWQLMSNSFQW